MSINVKARYLFLALVPYFAFYFLIQSLIQTGSYNLLTEMDLKIPFIPYFIWIYHTILPVILVTSFLILQKKDIFLALMFSNIFAGIVLCLFYVLFPAFYPREMFVDTATISGWLIEMTQSIDGPHNTFPSSHVTFAWLLVFFANLSQYVKGHRWLRLVYFYWAILISISTLMLKQHYIVDVISGFALAILMYFLCKRLFVREAAPKQLITLDVKFVSSRSLAE